MFGLFGKPKRQRRDSKLSASVALNPDGSCPTGYIRKYASGGDFCGQDTHGDHDTSPKPSPKPKMSPKDDAILKKLATVVAKLLLANPSTFLNSVPDPDTMMPDGRVFIDPTMRDEELGFARNVGGISAATAQKRAKAFKSSILPQLMELASLQGQLSPAAMKQIEASTGDSAIDLESQIRHFAAVSFKSNYGKSEAGQEVRDIYDLAKEMKSIGGAVAAEQIGKVTTGAAKDIGNWAAGKLANISANLPKQDVAKTNAALKAVQKGKFSQKVVDYLSNLPPQQSVIFENYTPSSGGLLGMGDAPTNPLLLIGAGVLLLCLLRRR